MIPLRQSTAATVPMGPFVDVNGDPVTTLTITQADVRLSKNGGAYAQKADATSAAHMEGGDYAVALNATDTGTAGRMKIRINMTGALPVWLECVVMPQAQFDSLYATGAAMPAQVTGMDPDTVTNLALATNAVNEIRDSILADSTPFNGANIDAAVSSRATPAEAADAVWDELLAGHAVPGSAGAALSAAGSAGDPWATLVPGAYGAGTAGNILGNRLDVPTSDAATPSEVNTEVAAALTAADVATGADVTAAALSIEADIAAVQADTDNIQTRLPTALSADGHMRADVQTVKEGGIGTPAPYTPL